MVRDEINHDTVQTLATLLNAAKTGEVIGLAYVAFLKGMLYITDVNGVCVEHPTFTRGAAMNLCDELANMVLERDPAGVR